MGSRRRTAGPRLAALGLGIVCTAALVMPSANASAPRGELVVDRPPGAGMPTAGSGIGTQAALDNPTCTDPTKLDGYGRRSSSSVGNGPICVRPFEAGEDNGGATTRGVTADKIKIVFVVPNPNVNVPGVASMPLANNRTTGQAGTDPDAVHDLLVPLMEYYETWGRDIEVVFFNSTGQDEAAQRADAISILAEKPFAVIDGDTTGLDTLAGQIAQAKTIIFSYATNTNEALAAAPYRWGGPDANVALINSAEAIGKQLVGKKAEWAGSEELQGQTRKFGLVSIEEIFDVDSFKEMLEEHEGELANESTYPANGGFAGDPTVSAAQAPSIVGKMKQAGVTTVVLAADVAMTKAMMEEGVKQDWYPEWWQTGFTYIDLSFFASTYPPEQAAHMFGLSLQAPYVEADTDPTVKALSQNTAPLDWYWGINQGTETARITAGTNLVMLGIHAAGPKLTPKTFRQGLFSVPASGGSASDTPIGSMSGYGETTGLPYPGYFSTPLDYAPEWISLDIPAPWPVIGGEAQVPSQMFVSGGTRYASGNWPTKKLPFFDPESSVGSIKVRPPGSPPPVEAPCDGCPSKGGTDRPGAESQSRILVPVPASASS
jgi:hypothetical protein